MRPMILINIDRHIDLIQRWMSNWAVCKMLSVLVFIAGNVMLGGMIIINWILRKEKINENM